MSFGNVRRPEPLIVTPLVGAMAPCERTFIHAKRPDWPPLMVTPPAGMTMVPLAVAVTLTWPWLTMVPPV